MSDKNIRIMRSLIPVLLACLVIEAQDKPKDKETVVMVQRKDGEGNERIKDSGNQLAKQLEGKGFDVDTVVMGDLPEGMDIASLDQLKDYLRGKLKTKDACYKSFHLLIHGQPSDSGQTGLVFPPDSKGAQVVVRDEDARPAVDDQPRQFGKANFAGLLDSVLCTDGEVYLESCWSAEMAQRLADELGRKVSGYHGLVVFEEGKPPAADEGSTAISKTSTTPSAEYSGSGEILRNGKKQDGLTYQWRITSNLKGICDVHIQLPKATDVKKFSNFKGPEGWKGSVTKQADGETYLSWYADDCAKNKQTKSFTVNVDNTDKKAQDKDPTKQKVIYTSKGGTTYKAEDVIREGTTPVPKFFASAEQPPTGGSETAALVGLVLPSDARPGEVISASLVNQPARFRDTPGVRVLQLPTPQTTALLIKAANSPFEERMDHAVTLSIPADGVLSLQIRSEDLVKPLISTTAAFPVPTEAPPAEWETLEVPPVIVKGSLQMARGNLAGSAVYTSVHVSGKPAPILVETRRAVYWQVPNEIQPGQAAARLVDGVRQADWQAYVVGLTITADNTKLLKGQSTSFHVVVSGLENMPANLWKGGSTPELNDFQALGRLLPQLHIPSGSEPGELLLAIENATPANIAIDQAPSGTLSFLLDREKLNGRPFEYSGTIRAHVSGGFRVNATLVPLFAPLTVETTAVPNVATEIANPHIRQSK